jgi:hypothetical protein
MNEPQRFFFVHVQKTAGTALWKRLKNQFAEREVYPAPVDGVPPDTTLSPQHMIECWRARRDEIRVVTGHFPRCTVELLDAPFVTLTLVRDPVERALSQLRHHRETTPEDEHLPLEAIYENPLRFELVHNHLVKMFSLTPAEMTDGMLTSVEFTPERLARAKEGLASISMIGLQTDFDAFCGQLERRYGWTLGPPIFMNRTKPVPVSRDFRRRIAADNADDLELYAHAVDVYAQRQVA